MPGRLTERTLYRRTNASLSVALVAYLALVVERERVHGREEIYPVSGWSLFSKVPNETQDYSIRLLAVRGRALEQPVYLEDAKAVLPAAWSSNSARVTIDSLGGQLDRGERERASQTRALLEQLYLAAAAPVTYELIARRFDPIERFRTGQFRQVRKVTTFHVAASGASSGPSLGPSSGPSPGRSGAPSTQPTSRAMDAASVTTPAHGGRSGGGEQR